MSLLGGEKEYRLPNHPSVRCIDRFSILDGVQEQESEDGLVPFWDILVAVLKQPIATPTQLVDVLDTISNTLRGSSGVAGDYGTLKAIAVKSYDEFFAIIWPCIVRLALSATRAFPNGSVPVLCAGDSVSLSTGQVACLVAHQFLCTLNSPSWRDGYYDFSIWYADEQRHPTAVNMYFTTLLLYFKSLDYGSMDKDTPSRELVTYSLHDFASVEALSTSLALQSKPLAPIEVTSVVQYSTELQEASYQGRSGAVVISANKHIGFGQSATQEELFVGNCPEACPAVLLTPPLADDQALCIDGARPMLRIIGQRRDISFTVLPIENRAGGRMLFMDALEIDEQDDSDGLPDIRLDNVEREIRKAYTAFSSWDTQGEPDDTLAKQSRPPFDIRNTIYTGVWGCGAFNGDPAVKMIIIWIAASMAGKKLFIICDPLHGQFPERFQEFTRMVPKIWNVSQLRNVLGSMPRDIKRLETMEWLLSRQFSA